MLRPISKQPRTPKTNPTPTNLGEFIAAIPRSHAGMVAPGVWGSEARFISAESVLEHVVDAASHAASQGWRVLIVELAVSRRALVDEWRDYFYDDENERDCDTVPEYADLIEFVSLYGAGPVGLSQIDFDDLAQGVDFIILSGAQCLVGDMKEIKTETARLAYRHQIAILAVSEL